jgi:hypothetical protein
LGLLGKSDLLDIGFLEEALKGMCKKEIKSQKKNEVKFDFKTKGSKPIVTKNVL